MYDSRIVRRWNTDPVVKHYESPYAVFDNNPILIADPLGNVGEPVVEKNGKLTIYSHLKVYGSKATKELANKAAANMQKQWSNAKGTVTYKGVVYKDVKFVVTSEVVSEARAAFDAKRNQGENYDPQLNFVRIESRKEVGRKDNQVTGEMGKAGDNSMYLLAEDIQDGNTTQSHEMGHGFGLMYHVAEGERFKGPPRIMTTVNTLVDAEYTKAGKATQMKNGKIVYPLNPDSRRVTQEDIDELNFNTYEEHGGSAERVGSSSNKLFTKNGKVIGGQAKEIEVPLKQKTP